MLAPLSQIYRRVTIRHASEAQARFDYYERETVVGYFLIVAHHSRDSLVMALR